MWGIEVKYQKAPTVTKSMHSALAELNLAHIWVIFPGDRGYPLGKKITAVGLSRMKEISTG